MYKVTLKCFRLTILDAEKNLAITYSKCVFVALVIQLAKRMRCVVLPSVACSALAYFSTISSKRHDFRKSVIEHKMCLDFLYNFV
jgi:hypothetical protein